MKMNNYSIWAQIRMLTGEEYEVDVRAIPLKSGVVPEAGDHQRERCSAFTEATRIRDELVKRVSTAIEDRGGKILSVDSTLGT